MKIIADENIPYVREAFGPLGDVVTLSGRTISKDSLKDADALLVRSITKVNRDMLYGTPVRFVATATIGEDHIDKAYLQEREIFFSSAPGCNANSVGDYLVAALLMLARKHRLDLTHMTLGIVGVGNVGKRVWKKAEALGLTCVLNDPPLAEQTGDPRYRPIEEIQSCDIVTFHVPLEKQGPHPTWHMADEAFLQSLPPGVILINSSRGPVVDNLALLRLLRQQHIHAAVLDVWEGEPNVDLALLENVDIGTPHIAGYSFDGKVNGTRQIYEAFCAFLGKTPAWDPTPLLPAPEVPELVLEPSQPGALDSAVHTVYDIMRDDAVLRGVSNVPESERDAYFDMLRKKYPRRREFFNTRVRLTNADPSLERRLRGIGFTLD